MKYICKVIVVVPGECDEASIHEKNGMKSQGMDAIVAQLALAWRVTIGGVNDDPGFTSHREEVLCLLSKPSSLENNVAGARVGVDSHFAEEEVHHPVPEGHPHPTKQRSDVAREKPQGLGREQPWRTCSGPSSSPPTAQPSPARPGQLPAVPTSGLSGWQAGAQIAHVCWCSTNLSPLGSGNNFIACG